MISIRNETLKTMRAIPVVVSTLVRGVDDDGLRWRPAQGEWAIIEVIAHMADTDEKAVERVRLMLSEDEPTLPAFDQVQLAIDRNYITFPVERELDRVDRIRATHVQILESLDDAGWHRTGRHGEHGLMTIELYETHVAAEDVDHLAQIARLIAARQGAPSVLEPAG